MKAIKLAFSLLMIPQLALRLIAMPIAIAATALFFQLWLMSLTPRSSGERVEIGEINFPRQIAYGASELRPKILSCKWLTKGPAASAIEFPPGYACTVAAHDVAFIGYETANGSKFAKQQQDLLERLDGFFEKAHFCKSSCAEGAGLVVSFTDKEPELSVNGFSNLLLLDDAVGPRLNNTDARTQFIFPGRKNLTLAGLDAPILLSGLQRQISKILGAIMLIICSVWLCLRAHKRVLDYFASSGSLLPLAASAGPRTLYSALWIVSLIRLLAFLAVSVPGFMALKASQLSIPTTLPENLASHEFAISFPWIFAVTASLVLTTLCASVADLKSRKLSSVLWRVVPLLLVGLGFLIWSYSLVAATPELVTVRHILVALPLLGLMPLIAAAVVQPPLSVIIIHALLASGLVFIVARKNARWFASHLEDT